MAIFRICMFLIFIISAIYSANNPYKKNGIWNIDNSNINDFVSKQTKVLVLFYGNSYESREAKDDLYLANKILSRNNDFNTALARYSVNSKEEQDTLKLRKLPHFIYFINDQAYEFGTLTLGQILRVFQKVDKEIIHVKNQEEINLLIKDNPPFTINVMYIGNVIDDEFKTIQENINAINFVNFSICYSEICQEKYPKALQSFVLFKNYLPNKEIIFDRTLPENEFTKERISEWIDLNTNGYVMKFNDRFISVGYGKTHLALVIFRKDNSKFVKKYNKILSSLKKKHDYSNFSFYNSDIDSDDDAKKASQFFLVHDKEKLPYVCIYDNREGNVKYYPFNHKLEVNEENIHNFLTAFQNGKVERLVLNQNEEEAENQQLIYAKKNLEFNSKVKALVSTNFHYEVIDNDNDVFVMFYADWCEHCHDIMNIFETLANILSRDNDNLRFKKIDMSKNSIDDVKLSEFPTFRLFTRNKKEEPQDYPGNAMLAEFTHFLKNHLKGENFLYSEDEIKEADEKFEKLEEEKIKKESEANKSSENSVNNKPNETLDKLKEVKGDL